MTLGTLIDHCYTAVVPRYSGDLGAAVAAYLVATVRMGRAGSC